MKNTARTLLSATIGLSLSAFALISGFTTGTPASLTATALGLLVTYALVELAIQSYSPRRWLRASAADVVSVPAALVRVPATTDFASCASRAWAA